MDARLEYTELNSLRQDSIIGAVSLDSLNIQTPGELLVPIVTIDGVNTDTVSAGKTNLTVEYDVINTGQASVRITTATPSPAVPANGFATLTRLSPTTLPTLGGGDTATFVYRGDAGLVAGNYDVNFNVSGTDQNDSQTLDTIAVDTANLVIRVPGDIVIDSVVVPLTHSIHWTVWYSGDRLSAKQRSDAGKCEQSDVII